MNLRSIKFTLFFYLFIFFTSIISAQISGTVFRDFNSNGVKNNSSTFNEPFVQGVTIKAYNTAGALVGTTTSGANGTYSFTGLTLPLRIEFTNYLVGDYSSSVGTGNNTSVQFYSAATTTANFGVNYPSDYCQTDPAIVTPVYVNGRQSGTEAFYSFPSSATGQTSATNNTLLAQSQEIGSTWGVAYDRVNQIIYTSAFLKRHVSLVDNNGDGKEDIGAIYTMSPSGSPSLWLDFQSLADVGLSLMPSITTRALPTDKTQPSHDGAVYDLVGKIGIGDIDISDDYKTLYLVNLYDKKVYSIDIATKTLIGSGIPVPNPCTGGSVRPFGLKYHRGKVYVGTVCDAQTSQSVSDLDANLYRLDAGTFNNILNIPIDYLKGIARTGGNANSDNWNPWTSTFFTSYYFEGYPQPIFADIEFDINEDVILVFDDRYGHQMGTFNYNTTTGSNLYTGVSSGDILRASYSGGTYTLENNGSVGGLNSSGGIGNNQGPGGGEFYYQDQYNDYHNETVEGGTALRAGSGQVAVAAYDPFIIYSAGIYWMNNTNGKTDRKYEVNSQGEVTGSFGKANGIGDIEMLCDPAPLEIGNRVWMDTDSDGVQDADEMGLDNITVKLFSGTTLVATKTTTNGGQYYFNTADGVLPNTTYTIRIEGASFPLNKSVTLKDQTTGGSQDLGDNDASLVGANADITYTTGNTGENNHTLDFGFKSGPTCTLSATCSSSPQTSCTPVNGSASVTATGAQGNLSYLWSSGETTSSISNKSAGTYTVTVTDDILSGCTATCQAIISNNTTPPTVSCSKIDNPMCPRHMSGHPVHVQTCS
ncbi:MAG: hypothetical protein IPL95_03535 [Saprospiraceae bacterium]|nr:hypothetical protein [Saprospiraceae bacterium]